MVLWRDWPVSQISRDQIWRDSLDLRKRLGVHALRRVDFLELLRNKVPLLGGRFSGLEVVVRPAAELGGVPAVTRYVDDKIRVFITDVIEASALRGDALAQKILGHEFGHARYHDATPKAFLAGEFEPIPYISGDECSAEWQADEAQLSMAAPEIWISRFANATDLARECNLIEEDAQKASQIYNLVSATRGEHPAYTAFKREQLRETRHIDRAFPTEAKDLWLDLGNAEGYDPFSYRLCPKGFLVCREEFNRMTPFGWRIKNGIVESYFNTMN